MEVCVKVKNLLGELLIPVSHYGGRRIGRGWEVLPWGSLGRDRNHLPLYFTNKIVPTFGSTLSQSHPIPALGGE